MNEIVPFEIERRFLIRMPGNDWFTSNTEYTLIKQTYLVAPEGQTARVRMRGRDGNYRYTHTVKTRLSSIRRIEREREIDKAEYEKLLLTADPARRTIEKRRYIVMCLGQRFEVDIFPFWNDRAIIELELEDEGQKITLPPDLTLIKEITDDNRYTNASLAKEVICEDL